MEKDVKLKLLNQLSQTRGEKAEAALDDELKKVTRCLAKETDYYVLNHCLEELNVIAFRVHDQAIVAVAAFLERLRSAECNIDAANAKIMGQFSAQRYLTHETLNIVERIRYFEFRRALEIYCDYSADADSTLRRLALDGLKKCAGYDLDIYFAGDNRAGLGEGPQLEVIDFLESRGPDVAETRLEAITTLAGELLSVTMEGTTWSYDSVTWSHGAVPPTKNIGDIRNRTIEFLKSLYKRSLSDAERRSIVSTMMTSTQLPYHGKPDAALIEIIEANTIDVLVWLRSIIPAESYPIRQKLEHDVYWLFYHADTEAKKAAALEVRDCILSDPEYDIYRTLIGFESIFEDWGKSVSESRDFSEIEKDRKDAARKFVSSISQDNWPQWKERIFNFCETRSNDLATFPIYFEFLYDLATEHPEFAFELVSVHLEKIEGFTIPLYRGLWASELKEELKKLALRYIADGKEITALSRLFIRLKDLDKDVLTEILKSTLGQSDQYVLSQLVAVAATNYELDPHFLVDELLVPTMKRLAEFESGEWIGQIWFTQEFQQLISALSDDVCAIILSALIKVSPIDYQSEGILSVIAEKNPKAVVIFFGDRIAYRDENLDYEPIPYGFQKLAEPLSKAADILVDTVRTWFRADQALFMFRGGRLIANVFPSFGEEIEAELQPLASSGNPDDAFFVIGVLRNYNGETFLHSICRQIIMHHHDHKSLMTEVAIILSSTGVVSGEFGLAEAYAKKSDEIEYWLKDEDPVIRNFAARYIDMLQKDETSERARAQEEIALRKHRYGEREGI